MPFPVVERYYADTGFAIGDGNSASKFILFRQLTQGLPSFIYKSMLVYGEDYIKTKKGLSNRESILIIKESIDDYLEDVQNRTIRRLDSSSFKELSKYTGMSMPDRVDKLNSIPIEVRINQIISDYKI